MCLLSLRLVPEAPFRVGATPGGLDTSLLLPPADTLFGALAHAYRRLYGEDALSKLLAAFQEGEPPFLLTSLFPMREGVRFYPRPFGMPPDVAPDGFLAEPVFLALARGEAPPPEAPRYRAPFRRAQRLRVTVDRYGRTSTLYEITYTEAQGEDASLHALVALRDPDGEHRLRAAVRLAAEEGIGGLRSMGLGRFRVTVEAVDLPFPEEGPAWVLLSPWIPSRAEFAALQGLYRLRTRRGWVTSDEGKGYLERSVRHIVEGSVVVGARPRGVLADVTPRGFAAHPVVRYGLAFAVPWLREGTP